MRRKTYDRYRDVRIAVLRKGPLLVASIALLTLFYFVVPGFLAPGNMLDLMQQIAVNAIIAFGLTLTILIGGIDLSVGAVLAVVGTTTVFMLGLHGDAQGLGWLIISVLIGLSVGAAFGAANGLCAAKTKMPAFIITLATMQIARGAAYRFNDAQPMRVPDSQTAFLAVGNGHLTIVNWRLFDTIPISVIMLLAAFAIIAVFVLRRIGFIQHLYAMLGNREATRFTGLPIMNDEIMVLICGTLAGIAGVIHFLDTIPISVIIMLVVFVLAAILLHRTRFGQHLYAIGGNREAARFTGIPIAKVEIVVYMICGALAGVAGMINASQLYSAEPASGIGFELDAIAAVVVGGTSFTGGIGGMWGTLIGAIIIGILSKGLNQAGVHFSLQYIVKGLVILSAVYFDVRRRK